MREQTLNIPASQPVRTLPARRGSAVAQTATQRFISLRERQTAAVTAGAMGFLIDHGYTPVTEVKLINRRRADIAALDARGRIVMVEVKSGVEDFRADTKWMEYLPFCDALYFAVPTDFPADILPVEAGILHADAHGAHEIRPAPEHPLGAARRRALTLRLALIAGARLNGVAPMV